MRRILSLFVVLAFLLVPVAVCAWTLPFSEDCEDGGDPPDGFDGQSETNSGAITIYEGANKNGSYSVQADTGATANSVAVVYESDGSAAESAIYALTTLWIDSHLLETTNTARFLWSYTANCASLAGYASIYNDAGTLYLQGTHGTVVETDSSGGDDYQLSLDTEYIIKMYYTPGPSGILKIWVRTPATTYGDPIIDISTGDDTDTIGCVRWGAWTNGANDNTVLQQDDMEISTTDPDPDPTNRPFLLRMILR